MKSWNLLSRQFKEQKQLVVECDRKAKQRMDSLKVKLANRYSNVVLIIEPTTIM